MTQIFAEEESMQKPLENMSSLKNVMRTLEDENINNDLVPPMTISDKD